VQRPLLVPTTVQTWQSVVITLCNAVGLIVCEGSAVNAHLPVDKGSG